MTTITVRDRFPLLRRPGTVRRALVAGSAWGLVTGIGLAVWNATQCGVFCLDAAVVDTLGAVTVGIFTIGPVAALGRTA